MGWNGSRNGWGVETSIFLFTTLLHVVIALYSGERGEYPQEAVHIKRVVESPS